MFNFISDPTFLLTSFSCLVFLTVWQTIQMLRLPRTQQATSVYLAILIMLISSIPTNCAWIAVAFEGTFAVAPFFMVSNIIRLGIPFSLIFFQASNFLIANLLSPSYKFTWDQKVMTLMNVGVFMYCITGMVVSNSPLTLHSPENILKAWIYCLLIIQTALSIFNAAFQMTHHKLPAILGRHTPAFICLAIITCLEAATVIPTAFTNMALSILSQSSIALLGTMSFLVTVSLFRRNVKHYRFLALNNHVGSRVPNRAIEYVLQSTAALSKINTIFELEVLAQNFFSDLFAVKPGSIYLRVHPIHVDETPDNADQKTRDDVVELAIQQLEHAQTTGTIINPGRILNRHELEFEEYYAPDESKKKLVELMETHNVDLIIPVDNKKTVLGYIIVDTPQAGTRLYSNVERDQMAVYAQNIAAAIHNLRTLSTHAVMRENKRAHHEVHIASKSQQLRIDMALKLEKHSNSHYTVGQIIYKNHKFKYANYAAEEMCGIPLTDLGHPMMKQLTDAIKSMRHLRGNKPISARNKHGELLLFEGVEYDGHTIITVTRGMLSEEILEYRKMVSDNEEWFLAMSLENTEYGNRLRTYYPSNNILFMKLKLQLLKLGLSQHPLIIEAPKSDLTTILNEFNRFNGYTNMGVFDAQVCAKSSDDPKNTATLGLFGKARFLRKATDAEGLLEIHKRGGIVLIKNIDLLDTDNQQQVLDFIETGTYLPLAGRAVALSQARIIVTLSETLQEADLSAKIIPELLTLLKPYYIHVPTLTQFSIDERTKIIDVVDAEHVFRYPDSTLLQESIKKKFIEEMPESIIDLASRIHKKKLASPAESGEFIHRYEEVLDGSFEPYYPHVLGVAALKSKKSLLVLVQKFKGATRISKELDVARSTVNKYLVLHGITPPKKDDPLNFFN